MDKRGQELGLQPGYSSGSGKKLIWGAVIAIAAVALVVGAYFIFGGSGKVVWKVYIEESQGFSIEYPNTWKQAIEDSKLFFYSPSTANVNVQGILKSSYPTKEDFVASLERQFQTLKDYEITDKLDLTINGRSATEITASYVISDVKYSQKSIIIDSEKAYYMISYTAWGGAYDKYLSIYEHMRDSFRLGSSSGTSTSVSEKAPAAAPNIPTETEQNLEVTSEDFIALNLKATDLPSGFTISNSETDYYEDVYLFSEKDYQKFIDAGWERAHKIKYYHKTDSVHYDAAITSTISAMSDEGKIENMINLLVDVSINIDKYTDAGTSLGVYGDYSKCLRKTQEATYSSPKAYYYSCRIKKGNYYLSVWYQFMNQDVVTLTQFKEVVNKVLSRIP